MKHIFSKKEYPAIVYPGMIVGGKYWGIQAQYKGAMPFVCIYECNNEIWFLGTRSIAGHEIYIPSRNDTIIENSLNWNEIRDFTFKVKLYLMWQDFTAIGRIPSYKDIETVDFDNNHYCIDRNYWLSTESTFEHGFYVNQWGYIKGDAIKTVRTIGVVPIVKLRFERKLK